MYFHHLPSVFGVFAFWALVLLLAGAALVTVLVGARTRTRVLLYIAAGALVLDVAIVATARLTAPPLVGLLLALIGIAVGVLGGSPITTTVLALSSVRAPNSANGGIMVEQTAQHAAREVLRGGTTIGYLERAATVAAIIAGFPEAIAVLIAIKGVGRFTELESSEVRERFIIGTLASLIWACLAGGLVRLAIS